MTAAAAINLKTQYEKSGLGRAAECPRELTLG